MKKTLTIPMLVFFATITLVVLAAGVSEKTNGHLGGGLKYDISLNEHENGLKSGRSVQISSGQTTEIHLNFEERKNQDYENIKVIAKITNEDGRNVMTQNAIKIAEIEGKSTLHTHLSLKVPYLAEQGDYKLELELQADKEGRHERDYKVHHYDLRIAGSDEEVLVKDILIQPNAEVDTAFDVSARIKNTGEYTEQVKVTASIPEFAVSGETYIEELRVGETVNSNPVTLKLPCRAIAGDYKVVITAHYNFQQKTETAETTYKLEGNICGRIQQTENAIDSEKYTAKLVEANSDGRFSVIVTNNDDVKRMLVLTTTENVQKYARFLPHHIAELQPGETQDITLDLRKLSSDEPVVFKIYVKDLEGNTVAEFREFVNENMATEHGKNYEKTQDLKHVLEIGLILLIIVLLITAVFVTFKQQKTA